LEPIHIPEPDRRFVPKPRIKVPQAEFATEVNLQVGPIKDDVRLVDREHGIPVEVRLVRHHPVTEDRDQPRSGLDELVYDLQRLVERAGPRPPLLQPEAVVLDVIQDALPGLIEPFPELVFVPDRQSGNCGPRGSAV
jgi:hypothetical protein